METATFNVKDKSLELFFKEHGIDSRRSCGDQNSYYFLKDVIFLKVDMFGVGERVIFELSDRGLIAVNT